MKFKLIIILCLFGLVSCSDDIERCKVVTKRFIKGGVVSQKINAPNNLTITDTILPKWEYLIENHENPNFGWVDKFYDYNIQNIVHVGDSVEVNFNKGSIKVIKRGI